MFQIFRCFIQIFRQYISQGSVATHLRCCGILNDHFITHFVSFTHGVVADILKEIFTSANVSSRYVFT